MSWAALRLGFVWAVGILLAGAPAQAQFVIVEVRTNYVPYRDFVGAVTAIEGPDGAANRRWEHMLVRSDDVTDGILVPVDGGIAFRTAEFFDVAPGDYRVNVKLISADGTALASRNVALLHTVNRVVTVLFADTRVAPNGTADKSASLLNDNDSDGQVSPGDVLRYTVQLNANEATEFRDTPSCGGRLVPGSVTTTRGVITRGNGPTDTEVRVTELALTPDDPATITFDVEVAPAVRNQGRLRFSGGDLLTNDPATTAAADATVTPVACSFVACAGDPDGDGVGASLDLCPKTPAGAAVDARGCSAIQFCGRIDVSTDKGQLLCRRADWGGDEPIGMPRDCRPSAGACVPE